MIPAVAIIPARGGSKRLPRKNLHPVLGQPMIAWVIRACQSSAHLQGHVYVSTEDAEMRDAAQAWGALVIDRPMALAGDDVPKQAAIIHAVEHLQRQGTTPDIVVSVQPNSPELTGAMLDAGIEKLLAHQLWEVFSVDPQLVQNGAFRVLRRSTVFQQMPSVHCGVIIVDCLDIHTREDALAAEGRLRARGAHLEPPVAAVPPARSR